MSRVTCLAMLCALSAHALGLERDAIGSPRTDPTIGRAVFTGAVTSNPTSIDLNPAALGLGAHSELYVAALGVVDRYAIDLSSTNASVTDHTASPGGTTAVIWHPSVKGRFTFGFQAMRTPPGERFLERDALRYHTMGGYHRVISPATVAASVRLGQRFYIGASVAMQSTFLKLRYARDTALEAGYDPDRGIDSDCDGAPCGIGNESASEDYEIVADNGLPSFESVMVNLGIVINVARDVWVGVGGHIPQGGEIPGLVVLTGTMEVERSPRDGGVAIRGASTVYVMQPASVDVGLRARLRADLDLHAGMRLEHLSRFQAYDVRGYGSTFPPAGIPEWQPRPRGFRNTVAAWAGVEQVEGNSPLVVGARLGFETSAVSDARTSPLTVAPTSLTADAGLQFRFAPRWLVQATYGLQFFPRVDVANGAYDPASRLACIESGYDYTTAACARVRGGYAISSADGSYSRLEHAMRLAVRFELD